MKEKVIRKIRELIFGQFGAGTIRGTVYLLTIQALGVRDQTVRVVFENQNKPEPRRVTIESSWLS